VTKEDEDNFADSGLSKRQRSIGGAVRGGKIRMLRIKV